MIRVFLVDDHTVLRRGLRLLLADQPSLVVVGEAGNGLELLEQLPAMPADVVLLDINVPGMDGEETTRQLHEQYPAAFVLAMSILDSAEHILHIFDAGALGYILKSAGLDEIVHGIRTVATERQFLCSELGLVALHKLCEGHSRPAGPAEKQGALSKRETEVLQLIAEGLTNAEIADKLFTSKRTIETHRQSIIGKTQTKNTASLIRFAVSEGIVH